MLESVHNAQAEDIAIGVSRLICFLVPRYCGGAKQYLGDGHVMLE